MDERQPQVTVSEYIRRPLIGKPENVTSLQVFFTGIDTKTFLRTLCGGCPGCDNQPGTFFIVKPDIRGSKDENSVAVSTEGETIEIVRKKIKRANCVKKTGAMDLVEAKLGEHGLSR